MAGEQPGKDIVYIARSGTGENGYGLSFVKWFLGLPVGSIQNRDNCHGREDTFIHDEPPKVTVAGRLSFALEFSFPVQPPDMQA